jgi:hypothetical protein
LAYLICKFLIYNKPTTTPEKGCFIRTHLNSLSYLDNKRILKQDSDTQRGFYSVGKKFAFSSLMKTIYLYNCDQPIVSETTRCESVDFIQTIDD